MHDAHTCLGRVRRKDDTENEQNARQLHLGQLTLEHATMATDWLEKQEEMHELQKQRCSSLPYSDDSNAAVTSPVPKLD